MAARDTVRSRGSRERATEVNYDELLHFVLWGWGKLCLNKWVKNLLTEGMCTEMHLADALQLVLVEVQQNPHSFPNLND